MTNLPLPHLNPVEKLCLEVGFFLASTGPKTRAISIQAVGLKLRLVGIHLIGNTELITA